MYRRERFVIVFGNSPKLSKLGNACRLHVLQKQLYLHAVPGHGPLPARQASESVQIRIARLPFTGDDLRSCVSLETNAN